MKLLVNKIVSEFNKIFSGTKRVGDSLKVEGKRMNQFDVLNSAKLGFKTESQLNVNKSVLSEKSVLLQSYDLNGEPKVNLSGNPVYITENQLSVNDSQYLRGVEPINLEVSIATKLRIDATRIINANNMFSDVAVYRVKDSALLGGKTEATLNVKRAEDADNADLLNDTAQNNLVVEKARIATKLLSDDGNTEKMESELNVHMSTYIKKNNLPLDIYQIRDWLVSTDEVKNVYIKLAASSSTLTTPSGNKSFTEIMTHIKDDLNSEAYKSARLITTDSNTPAKTGDQYKTWIINHNDLKDKVKTLTALLSDRAVRFGSDQDNVNIDEMDTRIVGTTVNLSKNSNLLQNNSIDDIISTMRTRILSQSSSSSTGLTNGEIEGFFGNNNVKLAIQAIKTNKSINADTLTDGASTITLSGIYQQVKDNGGVLSAKYIYANPITNTGQISYTNITQDITNAKTSLIDNATSSYISLGKIETIIKTNKTNIESALSTEATTRTSNDTTLQNNIDTESDRIDVILNGADTNKKTFVGITTYIDSLTGNLSSTTIVGSNIVSITNALNTKINALETSTLSNTNALGIEVNAIESAVGLTASGTLNTVSGNYINGSSTMLNAITKLDTALKSEESSRTTNDNALNTLIGTVSGLLTTNKSNLVSALNEEINRAKGVEGTLSLLTTSAKSNLVSSINEVVSSLGTEETERTNGDDALNTKITTNLNSLNSEISRAKGVEGTLTLLSTTVKTNLVVAINEVFSSLSTEKTDRINGDDSLNTKIDTEKGRIDAILSASTADKNSFKEIVDLINSVDTTNDSAFAGYVTSNNSAVSVLTTNLSNEVTRSKGVEGTLSSLTTTVKTNLVVAINEVFSSLSTEKTDRINGESSLNTKINTEKGRIDAILSASTTDKDSFKEIVDLINSVDTTNDSAFAGYVTSNNSAVSVLTTNLTEEINRAKGVEGTLSSLTTTVKTNLVVAINEIFTDIENENIRAVAAEEALQDNIDGLSIGDIAINGHIIPDTNISYDLGSATKRFKGLYLDSNTIHIGDYAISVNTSTGVLSTIDSTDIDATAANLLSNTDIGNTVQAYSSILDNTSASFTTTLNTKLNTIDSGAQVNDSNTTLQGNSFNSNNQLVKLDSNGKFYAIDGTNLTNINAKTINGKTVEENVPIGAKFTDTTYSIEDGGLSEHNYTTAEMTKVSKIVIDGVGDSYLSDDGNYNAITSLTSNNDITLTASNRVKVIGSPFKLPLFSTVDRDLLSAEDGDMIYNSDESKFQGYQNSVWVNLDGI